jgi:hypothetical protein
VRRFARALLVAAAFSLVAGDAVARPGGGSTFSRPSSGGGSRSGFSGGSGSRPSSGSGGRSTPNSPPPPPRYLWRGVPAAERKDTPATWLPGAPSAYGEVPERPSTWPPKNELSGAFLASVAIVFVGVILALVALGLFVIFKVFRKASKGWSTAPAQNLNLHSVTPLRRRELEVIKNHDPDFSLALFEDFLYALYAEAHMARGAGKLGLLAPYLRPHVRGVLAARSAEPAPVSSVVIGAMRFVGYRSDPDPTTGRDHVEVEFEANYAETPPGKPEHAYWVLERWQLSRPKTARSRPPERARVFDCPNCGAPLDKLLGSACGYCQRTVDSGDFDWIVENIQLVHSEQRGPMLTGTTEEVGTDLPTVFDAELTPGLSALKTKDPAFAPDTFQQRVGLVFSTMQHAWSSLEWHNARPYLTDNLFNAQRYWIEAYRRAGLRNVNEGARVLRIDLARVASDKWFDSLTVRVFATGLDYTIRDYDKAVVGGSRSNARTYSEYWTLIRGSGVAKPTTTTPSCPQCGAPLQVNMAGDCTHCKARVHSGQFDWVLARIEQDEAYTG